MNSAIAWWTARVAVLALVVVGLALPGISWTEASSRPEMQAGVTIQSDDITVTVDHDGSAEVGERVKVHVTGQNEIGLVQYFPRATEGADGVRREPRDVSARIISASADATWRVDDARAAYLGADAPAAHVELTSEQGGRTTALRTGDEATQLDPGVYVYQLRYTIDGVLQPGDHGARLDWDALPAGWPQQVVNATVTVTLPGKASGLHCTAGGKACATSDGEGAATLDASATNLAPFASIAFHADVDTQVPGTGAGTPWASRWDPVLGTGLVPLLLIVVLALAALAGGIVLTWWVGGWRTARVRRYSGRPAGLGPVQGAYLATGQLPEDTVLASLFEAAARGVVLIRAVDRGWAVDRADDATVRAAGLDPVTLAVVEAFGQQTTLIRPQDPSAGQVLRAARAAAADATHGSLRDAGGVKGPHLRLWLILAVVVAALATVGLAIWHPGGSVVALIPGAFLAGALPCLSPQAGVLRTTSGLRAQAEVRAFAGRLDGSLRSADVGPADPHADASNLPWAVALGVGKRWADARAKEAGRPMRHPSYLVTRASDGYKDVSSLGMPALVADLRQTLASAGERTAP
ncbi:MAG: DUF2207 domain-containing protein [Promicromonosporaceae bacterium]|nr:DUF2207 domain-containing protein [Promicromonosporaceae bacterium]